MCNSFKPFIEDVPSEEKVFLFAYGQKFGGKN